MPERQIIWILMKQEMMGWQWHELHHINHLHFRSRQITTRAPHHSLFLQTGGFSGRPVNSVKALKAFDISWHLLY